MQVKSCGRPCFRVTRDIHTHIICAWVTDDSDENVIRRLLYLCDIYIGAVREGLVEQVCILFYYINNNCIRENETRC